MKLSDVTGCKRVRVLLFVRSDWQLLEGTLYIYICPYFKREKESTVNLIEA